MLGRNLDPTSQYNEVFGVAGYEYVLPRGSVPTHVPGTAPTRECLQGHVIVYGENPYGALDPVSSHVSSLTLRFYL